MEREPGRPWWARLVTRWPLAGGWPLRPPPTVPSKEPPVFHCPACKAPAGSREKTCPHCGADLLGRRQISMLPDGPWIDCPWCAAPVPLSRFAPSDEEPGVQVAVCGTCGRRVPMQPPRHPVDG